MNTAITTTDQNLIDGLATSNEFTTPEEMFGTDWNTPTLDIDALLDHLDTLNIPARTDEDIAAAEAAARAKFDAFWTPERIAEHDKIMAQHESVKATREALAEFRSTACARCGGTGILPQFVRVNGGECFTCNGTGKR